MFITNLIAYLILIYLAVYALYFLTFIVKSFNSKKFLKEQEAKLLLNTAQNNLCVIIWASDKNKNLYELLKILNNQTYPKSNYEVHVMYKNSAKNKTVVPDFAHGARIHSIENPEYYQKDRALSMFVEKIILEDKFDAFLFLGADRLVGENYLDIANRLVEPSTVIVGATEVIKENDSLFKRLFTGSLKVKTTLTNNTIRLPRAIFDLCQTIDSENCIISADILEQTGRVCFETRNDELKYSLFLASNDIKPIYSPFLKAYTYVKHLNLDSPSLKQAWSLFKYYLPYLFKKQRYFIEYLAFIFRPTTLFILALYFTLFVLSFTFKTTIQLKYILHFGLFLIIIMLLSVVASKFNPHELLELLLSPIAIFVKKFRNSMRLLDKKIIKRQNEEEKNTNSATVTSLISNGKRDNECKLDLIKEEGMKKVVFRYNKKQFESDAHLRMCDALNEVTSVLGERGFILKVCQNCKFFEANNDGNVDMLKGFCRLNSDEETPTEILIWNGCSGFSKR